MNAETTATAPEPAAGDDVLLRIENLVKYFPVQSRQLFRRDQEFVHAVDGVSLEVRRGQTLGLVGETGCGKSTLARCVMRLFDLTSGRIIFDGQDISKLKPRQMRPFRREMQMIFQDPYGSLNPRRRVGSIIGDPFAIHKTATGQERKRKVQEVMELVGLNPEHFNRFPAEFSGGQRQRIGVARALAFRPKLIVCDEPVSALDVSIQAQIINLLADLQSELGLTYIFIAHDLSVVRHVSNRVAVMYLGKVSELAPVDDLWAHPRHPYTDALLSAVPGPGPGQGGGSGSGSSWPGTCPRRSARRQRLPVPPAVPEGGPDVRGEGSRARAAARRRGRPPGRLPLPGRRRGRHLQGPAHHRSGRPRDRVRAARQRLSLHGGSDIMALNTPQAAEQAARWIGARIAAQTGRDVAKKIEGTQPLAAGHARGCCTTRRDDLPRRHHLHRPGGDLRAGRGLDHRARGLTSSSEAAGRAQRQTGSRSGPVQHVLARHRRPGPGHPGPDRLWRPDLAVRRRAGHGISVAIGGARRPGRRLLRRPVDTLLARLMDWLLAIPFLLFAISLVTVDRPGLRIVLIIVIGFFGWASVGRIVRGQVLSIREKEYIEAARSLGAGPLADHVHRHPAQRARPSSSSTPPC